MGDCIETIENKHGLILAITVPAMLVKAKCILDESQHANIHCVILYFTLASAEKNRETNFHAAKAGPDRYKLAYLSTTRYHSIQ